MEKRMDFLISSTWSMPLIVLVALSHLVSVTQSQETNPRHDPTPIIYPGQVNIGVLSSVHASAGPNATGCGSLRLDAVQRVMAAVWAAHQSNFRKEDPQELNIGVYIFDTCGREDIAQRQVFRLLGHVGHVQTTACTEKKIPPLFAVITEGDEDSLRIPVKMLDAYGIPVISTSSPPSLDPASKPENHLSTAPTTAALARAAVTVLRQLRLLEVAVIAEDDSGHPSPLFGDFSREAMQVGMQALPVDHPSVVPGDPENFLASLHLVSEYGKSRLKAVVFLISADQALDLLRSVDANNTPQVPWVIVTPSDISPVLLDTFDRHHLRRLQQVLLLSPETEDIPEFDVYFRQLLQEDTAKYHRLLVEFISVLNGDQQGSESLLTSILQGSAGKTEAAQGSNATSSIESGESHSGIPIVTTSTSLEYKEADVSAVVKAMWALSASLRTVQKRSCRRGTDCLLYLRRSLSAYVLKAAKAIDHMLDANSGSINLQGTRLKFGEDGVLNSVRFSLKGFTFRGDVQEVGWYSDENGLAVDHDVISPFNGFVFREVEPPNSKLTTSTPQLLSKFKFRPEKALVKPTTNPTPFVDLQETTVDETEGISFKSNPLATLPLEETDDYNWKILDDTSATFEPTTTESISTIYLTENYENIQQPSTINAEDLFLNNITDNDPDSNQIFVELKKNVETSHAERNFSTNTLESELDIIVGPSYKTAQQSSSNMRSISLTSHNEPKLNNPFESSQSNFQFPINAAPGSSVLARSLDRTVSGVIPSTASEDVKVVAASRNLHMSAWLARPWALTVLGICGFGILITLYVLVFLMVKACEGSLKKNNSCVAVSQLIALLSLYVSAGLFTWKPSPLLCGLQRLVPNISYAFCFGNLLLKGMHMRAQNNLGLGGSINRCNQMLTLLFIVGVQVALEIQWWFIKSPGMSFAKMECAITKEEILESQGYVSFLLLLSTIVALATRRVPYNYQEGRSLIGTTVACLFVFLAWDVACWLLPDASSRNIAAPSALIVTALVVLAGIFGPQLFAIHKYGGFPHKPLSYADSLSTVFTMFKDLDNASSSGTTGRGKKTAKTLETPFANEIGERSRNPLYSDYQSAYP